MNIEALQALLRDEAAFKKAFRKKAADRVVTDSPKNDVFALIAGQFKQGRMPFIHQVTLPDGSQIRLKFYNTVKKLFNNKNVELIGKESYLSYLEVTVAPVGMKAYCWTMDVQQVVWGTSKKAATVKHEAALENLKATADDLQIDLSAPASWATVYTENY